MGILRKREVRTFRGTLGEKVGQGDESLRDDAPLAAAAAALVQLQAQRPRAQRQRHDKGKVLVPLRLAALQDRQAAALGLISHGHLHRRMSKMLVQIARALTHAVIHTGIPEILRNDLDPYCTFCMYGQHPMS